MFGTPFGLGLEVDDVDRLIFLEKIKKKLVIWCFIHISLAKNTIIVNQMLFCIGKRFINGPLSYIKHRHDNDIAKGHCYNNRDNEEGDVGG